MCTCHQSSLYFAGSRTSRPLRVRFGEAITGGISALITGDADNVLLVTGGADSWVVDKSSLMVEVSGGVSLATFRCRLFRLSTVPSAVLIL